MAHTIVPQLSSQPIERAIEVFARGFAFTRSLTHPYLAERVGPLWVMRDGPRRKAAGYRNEEYIAWNVEPSEVDRLARRHTRGRYSVCAIHAAGEDDTALRAGYKAAHYRLRGTEPFMVQRLAKIPRFAAPAGITIERVLTQPIADRLNKTVRHRQIFPEHLRADASLRQYAAFDGEQVVGWVRSLAVHSEAFGPNTWCSNMAVIPAYRRRGIARALLSRMLLDDWKTGSTMAVLLASHTGALVYPLVGYEQIATLNLYSPGK